MFLIKTAPPTKSETLLSQQVYPSISIPQVSRNTIRSLLYTVMLSTSAAHRLSSNSVMSSGRFFTVYFFKSSAPPCWAY